MNEACRLIAYCATLRLLDIYVGRLLCNPVTGYSLNEACRLVAYCATMLLYPVYIPWMKHAGWSPTVQRLGYWIYMLVACCVILLGYWIFRNLHILHSTMIDDGEIVFIFHDAVQLHYTRHSNTLYYQTVCTLYQKHTSTIIMIIIR